MLLTAKPPSPSAKSRALGEAFPECQATSRGQFNAVGAISFFTSSPSATLEEEIPFFETSSPSATLGEEFCFFKKPLPRVLVPGTWGRQTTFFYYKPSSPSAAAQALGEATFFARIK
jgi:hypothetical protein